MYSSSDSYSIWYCSLSRCSALEIINLHYWVEVLFISISKLQLVSGQAILNTGMIQQCLGGIVVQTLGFWWKYPCLSRAALPSSGRPLANSVICWVTGQWNSLHSLQHCSCFSWLPYYVNLTAPLPLVYFNYSVEPLPLQKDTVLVLYRPLNEGHFLS